jgi:hypothetical protein
MAKARRLLKHVAVERAKGRRRCRRDATHEIAQGESCLVVRDEATLQLSSYCSRCAVVILKQCANDLRAVRDTLYPAGPPENVDSCSSGDRSVTVPKKRVSLTSEGIRVEVYDAPSNTFLSGE